MEGVRLQRPAEDALGLRPALPAEQRLAVALARGEQPGPPETAGAGVPRNGGKTMGKPWENKENRVKRMNYQPFCRGFRISEIFLPNILRDTPTSNCGNWWWHVPTGARQVIDMCSLAIEHGNGKCGSCKARQCLSFSIDSRGIR